MILRSGLSVELHGFLDVFARSPAELVAECSTIAGFGVAMFAGCDEEGECAVIVFVAFAEEAGGIAIGEIVLCEGVAAI